MIFLKQLFFKVIKNKYILIGVGVLILCLSGYFYIAEKDEKIKELTEKTELLGAKLQTRELQVQSLKEQAKKTKVLLDKNLELQQHLRDTQAIVRVTVAEELEVFENNRLESLSVKKPGLIQIKVNKATNKVFDTLEKESREFTEAVQ